MLVGNTLATGRLRRTAKRAHDDLTPEEAALDDEVEGESLPEVESLFDRPKAKLPSSTLKRTHSRLVHLGTLGTPHLPCPR